MENKQKISNFTKEMEQELIRGHESANQLLEVIINKLMNIPHHGDLEYAQDLINKVLRSFTNSLFLLNTNNSEEKKVFPLKYLSPPKLQDVDKACKRFEHKRGCYKRKSDAVSWEKESSILIEDGYEWRKYGQKNIINAKYIRSYYRCSYKNEQECLAMKQVQRIKEEPPLYRTTYYGHHSCKITSLLEPNHASSMFLSFNNEKQQLFPTKEEAIDEVVINNPYDDQNNQFIISSSDSDYYPLKCDLYEYEFDYLKHPSSMISSSSTQSLQFHDYGF